MKRDAQSRAFRGNGNDKFSQENILCMIRRCYLAGKRSLNANITRRTTLPARFVSDFHFSVETHGIVTVIDVIRTKR